MPIVSGELKMYKSEVVSDASTNGGAMSANEVVSNAASNLFPPVQQSERIAGGIKYRKFFYKNANDDDDELFDPKIFLDQNTPGDDIMSFFPATQSDTQNDITGSERQYGGGVLAVSASTTDVTVQVLVEDAQTINPFVIGDTVRITDKTDINDMTGNEEFVVLSDVQVDSNDVITLTFSPALQNDYLSSNARVQSVYEPANIIASFDSLVVTAAGSGDFDGNFLFPDNIGGIEQTWTLTFTSATAFDIVGDTVGAVGSGTTGAGASPNNTDFSKPYFVMQAAGFSGTFAAADTIVFNTHPAAAPVWAKRTVPAGTNPLANNTATFALQGETA